MIEWWGPILHEYYGGTEGMGTTTIDSAAWLAHPGSVGRPSGCVDPHRRRRRRRARRRRDRAPSTSRARAGSSTMNDPAKTASIQEAHGWRTLGDVGHLDEDGYLYLTDRATFMIISGGVNIYPQEIENVLVMHPVGQRRRGLRRSRTTSSARRSRPSSSPPTASSRPPSSKPSSSPTAASTSPATRSPGRSTSWTSCPATRRASSSSAGSATRTGQARTQLV